MIEVEGGLEPAVRLASYAEKMAEITLGPDIKYAKLQKPYHMADLASALTQALS
ncbi:hypothetical protein [Yoonia sp. SDW83-1]|uniref:hypothetical protein n=1 Tax=Yoonia sp. SDW83-1 TaxID=3366945 RepID=UPI00398C4056